MQADKSQNEKQFDQILTDGLGQYKKTVSPDFTDKVISRLQLQTQQKLLAKVILQERLAIAGCVITSIAAIAVISFFPQVIETLSSRMARSCSSIAQTIISGQFEWKPLLTLTIAVVTAACGIFELFFAKN